MDARVYGDRIRMARVLRGMKAIDLAQELRWPSSRQTIVEQSEIVALDQLLISDPFPIGSISGRSFSQLRLVLRCCPENFSFEPQEHNQTGSYLSD